LLLKAGFSIYIDNKAGRKASPEYVSKDITARTVDSERKRQGV